ncbi:MAG: LrgB family protein, partial [Sphaerochaetaceae bacterium]|nr:LrgB family protein [Sphaerochaetaceae bacterium]
HAPSLAPIIGRQVMNELLHAPMFGIALTLCTYAIGLFVSRKVHSPLANPMVVASILCIAFLKLTGIPLAAYAVGGDFLVMLIFPATTCIAVSVYSRMDLLKRHFIPIAIGCTVGATVSILSVRVLSRLVGLPEILTNSLLPKSVTTAIALELAGLFGGEPSLTVVAVMVTGISVVLGAPFLIRLFGITDPIVQGVALGTSSHVIGTTKALELGQTQGAMSGIAIFITGCATVIVSLLLF